MTRRPPTSAPTPPATIRRPKTPPVPLSVHRHTARKVTCTAKQRRPATTATTRTTTNCSESRQPCKPPQPHCQQCPGPKTPAPHAKAQASAGTQLCGTRVPRTTSQSAVRRQRRRTRGAHSTPHTPLDPGPKASSTRVSAQHRTTRHQPMAPQLLRQWLATQHHKQGPNMPPLTLITLHATDIAHKRATSTSCKTTTTVIAGYNHHFRQIGSTAYAPNTSSHRAKNPNAAHKTEASIQRQATTAIQYRRDKSVRPATTAHCDLGMPPTSPLTLHRANAHSTAWKRTMTKATAGYHHEMAPQQCATATTADRGRHPHSTPPHRRGPKDPKAIYKRIPSKQRQRVTAMQCQYNANTTLTPARATTTSSRSGASPTFPTTSPHGAQRPHHSAQACSAKSATARHHEPWRQRRLRRWATTNHGKLATLPTLGTSPTLCTNDRRRISMQTCSLTGRNLKTITRSRLRIQPSSRTVLNSFSWPSTKCRPLRTCTPTGCASSITPARLYLFSSPIRGINHDPTTTICRDYRMPMCPHHDNITLGKKPQRRAQACGIEMTKVHNGEAISPMATVHGHPQCTGGTPTTHFTSGESPSMLHRSARHHTRNGDGAPS